MRFMIELFLNQNRVPGSYGVKIPIIPSCGFNSFFIRSKWSIVAFLAIPNNQLHTISSSREVCAFLVQVARTCGHYFRSHCGFIEETRFY